MEGIPDYVIEDACQDLVGVDKLHVSQQDASALATWLLGRRAKLSDLIRTNEHMFPLVQEWTLPETGAS